MHIIRVLLCMLLVNFTHNLQDYLTRTEEIDSFPNASEEAVKNRGR